MLSLVEILDSSSDCNFDSDKTIRIIRSIGSTKWNSI